MNIWIGMAVNGSFSHLKEMKGNSLWSGDCGRKAMKLNAPIVIS